MAGPLLAGDGCPRVAELVGLIEALRAAPYIDMSGCDGETLARCMMALVCNDWEFVLK
jgi:hypothetical protein